MMYEISEKKDINIKHIERIIKESAFDCALNYERNFIENYDYQRECDYTKCEYNCDGISPSLYKNSVEEDLELDYSTYQLYYNNKQIDTLINEIKILYKTNYQIDLITFFNYFTNFNKFEIITALRNVINENIIIYNSYGFNCYLKENNNIYFLVDNLSSENNFLSEYYTKYPIIHIDRPISIILNEIYVKISPIIIKTISTIEDMNTMIRVISKLSPELNQKIIENSLISRELNISKCITQRNMILEIFKNYFKNIDEFIVINNKNLNKWSCLDTKNIKKGWSECNNEIIIKYKSQSKEDNKCNNSPYDYCGLENPFTKSFCIKNKKYDIENEKIGKKDTRKKNIGAVCGTGDYNKEKLLNLCINIFKIPIPSVNLKEVDLKNNQRNWKELNKYNNDIEKIKIEIQKLDKYEIIDENDIENSDINRIKSMYYWLRQGVNEMCVYLKTWLTEKNLIDIDDNCGTNKKNRKDEV